jgi:hypothetical protein
MKLAKWILLGVVGLVIVAIAIVWLSLDSIVRSTVQSQGTQQLGVQTTLGGANVSLFGGALSLSDLAIASPKGFTAPSMFTLGKAAVGVSLGQLTSKPIHIQTISIHAPALVIEQQNMKLNIKALVDQMPTSPTTPDKTADQKDPVKVVIDDLAIDNATVSIHPGDIPGVKLPDQLNLTIPSIDLKNIGNADGNNNGAAIKEVVTQVITALADKASQSDQLPPELKTLMSLNVNQISAQLGTQFNQQLGKTITDLTKNLPPDIGKNLNLNKLTTQPAQAVQKDLQDLIGGKKKSK